MVGAGMGEQHAFVVVSYGGRPAAMKNFNDPAEAIAHLSSLDATDRVLYHGDSDSHARKVLTGEVPPQDESTYIPAHQASYQTMYNQQVSTPEYDYDPIYMDMIVAEYVEWQAVVDARVASR